jgi:hypothetical protein
MEIDQLYKNPNKFGFPTFEQYAKNPERYISQFRGRETESLDVVANGSSLAGLRKSTQDVVYKIFQYETRKLEEVERIARENGIDLRKLKFKAIIQNMGGHRGQIVVRFMSQDEYERRETW